jgi:hypothetical protein
LFRRNVERTTSGEGSLTVGKARALTPAALLKGRVQVEMKGRLGRCGPAALRLFKRPTESLFGLLKHDAP